MTTAMTRTRIFTLATLACLAAATGRAHAQIEIDWFTTAGSGATLTQQTPGGGTNFVLTASTAEAVTTRLTGSSGGNNFVLTPGVDSAAMLLFCDGDANEDRKVSFTDLTMVLARFATPLESEDLRGDSNGDLMVNMTDVQVVLANFGTDCP